MAFLLLLSSLKAADIDWFMQLGLGGGDTLGEIEFYNATSEKISVGDGFSIGTGIHVRPSQETQSFKISNTL